MKNVICCNNYCDFNDKKNNFCTSPTIAINSNGICDYMYKVLTKKNGLFEKIGDEFKDSIIIKEN